MHESIYEINDNFICVRNTVSKFETISAPAGKFSDSIFHVRPCTSQLLQKLCRFMGFQQKFHAKLLAWFLHKIRTYMRELCFETKTVFGASRAQLRAFESVMQRSENAVNVKL